MPQSFRRFTPDTPAKRNLKKVPFVELFNGRVQGVAASGSDPRRVYVSWLEAGTGNFYCSTNNNRRCGGLGGPCKHIQAVFDNATAQYGRDTMGRFLGVDPSVAHNAWQVQSTLGGTETKDASGPVFSRFLDYLRYVELPLPTEATPEMAWFVTGR